MTNLDHPKQERTFLLIKPDGVMRGLTGEVIKRVERVGLKIVALEMFHATREQVDNHYPKDEKWLRRLGEKTAAAYEKYDYDMKEELGTTDLLAVGQLVRRWLIDFLTMGPSVRMIVEGYHAIDMVRKLVGPTIPAFADLGTIRGDFSVDSPAAANREKRAVFNLIHASETREEAEHEIGHWFGRSFKPFRYDRTDEMVFWKTKG